jgi:ubiquinone/menaquinone biosynthesis C-methylase UbiE
MGMTAVGIDVSEYATTLAKKRGFEAFTSSIEALPLESESVDLITAKHTLEHADHPKAAIAELFRVLRPGGAALILVPDAQYWKASVFPQTGRFFVPSQLGWQHHVYYAVGTLSRALRDAGFEVVSSDKAIFRSRKASSWRRVWEYIRYASVRAGTSIAKCLHLRREIQLIAVKR